MRRFAAVFLVAFCLPMGGLVYVSLRSHVAAVKRGDRPLVGTQGRDLPPPGEAAALEAKIYVYEGDRLVGEILGDRARFAGRDRATFEGTRISAWPEKGNNPRQPEEVEIRADRAEVDTEGRTARMSGNVSVKTGTGDTLTASDLDVDFGKKTLDTDGPVEFKSGEQRLRGTGFHGSMALHAFRLERGVAGRFHGTQADFSAASSPPTDREPEDVAFTAGGPVSVETLEEGKRFRRTRLLLDGGVVLTRVDTKSPEISSVIPVAPTTRATFLQARTVTADLRRDLPPDPPRVAAWRALTRRLRAAGIDPKMPDDIRALARSGPASMRLERLDARGDVVLRDARVGIEADGVVTENRADGSSRTTVSGPTKRLVFRERTGMQLGPLQGPSLPGAPIEVTCIEDVVLARDPDSPEGRPGRASASMKRWVQLRDGDQELSCDALELLLVPQRAFAGGDFGYAPHSFEATGNVMLEAPGQSARADRMKWDAGSDRLALYGRPRAEVATESMRLSARRIFFDNRNQRATALRDVTATGEGADVGPGSLFSMTPKTPAPGATRWKVRCDRLEAQTLMGDVRSYQAAGNLVIETDDSVTTADVLNSYAGLTTLVGEPVRVVSGRDLVEAGEIVINTADKRAFLYGVRRMLTHPKGGISTIVGVSGRTAADPDAESPVTLRARGPVTVDQLEGYFLARGGVSVTGDDARLDADRLRLEFDPETRALVGALATGRVLLRAPDLSATGSRLTWDAASATAGLAGPPDVLLTRNDTSMHANEILIADGGKTITFLARYSRGSISFPDKDRPRKKSGSLRNPFGDLLPETRKKETK